MALSFASRNKTEIINPCKWHFHTSVSYAWQHGAFTRYVVQDPLVKDWFARMGWYLLETFPLLFFCVSLEIKMTKYPFHYKNCWSNIFQSQCMENKTADCILLSFTKKPSGLLQHWMTSLMLLVLRLRNPLQAAYGAKSAVVLHHVHSWSPSKGQGSLARAALCSSCCQLLKQTLQLTQVPA